MPLGDILQRIGNAEAAAYRKTGSVRLIAVSKLQPEDRIRAVIEQGHHIFGENRVQEAEQRWPRFRERFPDLELHLVGPLQTNKTRQAMMLFNSIHSVDRLRLVRRIAGQAQKIGSCPEIFIQVNTGEEPQKSGVLPDQVDNLVSEARALDLPVEGLMCLPPIEEEPALHFALLSNIAQRNGLSGLSMGMSADFETAIHLGATHVRIGTAVFGRRPTAKKEEGQSANSPNNNG